MTESKSHGFPHPEGQRTAEMTRGEEWNALHIHSVSRASLAPGEVLPTFLGIVPYRSFISASLLLAKVSDSPTGCIPEVIKY